MGSLLSALLDHYGLQMEDYASLTREPSFSYIPQIKDLPETKAMIKRLERARDDHEKVIIYGDYDTDGVMSASIIKEALRRFGIEAGAYLPSRYQDGYGINLANAERIAKAGYSLLICVDNGVAAFEALNYLKGVGIDVLVIDHHEIQGEPAPCLALIHPVTSHYGEYPVSAGYLSFLFSWALHGEPDEYLATLGGISTLSDMMSLLGHNRELVRLSLKFLNDGGYPQISAVIGNKDAVGGDDLSMSLIPAINAVGRMQESPKDVTLLVSYFTSEFSNRSMKIAEWMKQINEGRKELTRAASASLEVNGDDPAIVVVGDLKEGLNGLLANRLLQQYEKVTCVFSRKENDPSLLVGSMRALEGFSVAKALEGMSDILVAGGGHELAGGLTIKAEDLDSFKKMLSDFALMNPITAKQDGSIEISVDDVTIENVDLMNTFGPFGQEWKKPKFILKNFQTNQLRYIKDGRYVSTLIHNNARIFSFALGQKDFAGIGECDLIGTLRIDSFRDKVNPTFLLEKISC